MATLSVKKFTVVGRIDGNPTTIGGFLGDYQRRALSDLPVKENNTGRRVGVLGIRMCRI